ncbi:hypothetical protein [Cuniculiplasma divulgatum]|nr:hypothetical protein [Cuniculiplasma divulgatum]
MINAACSVIKYSNRMKRKYLGIVKRLWKNRAIIAIVRILLDIIYTISTNRKEFISKIAQLREKKMNIMRSRTIRKSKIITVKKCVNDLSEVQKKNRKRTGDEGKLSKADTITLTL